MNDGGYMFPEFEELRFRNYKSFEDFSSIFQLKNINVFIGRNNCGKSSCIDVLQALVDEKIKIGNTKIEVDYKINAEDFKLMMQNSRYRQNAFITPDSRQFVNKKLVLSMNSIFNGNISKKEFDYNGDTTIFNNNELRVETIISNFNRRLQFMKCYRLNAERNIIPEQEEKKVELSEDGAGATNVVNHILNYANLNESIVHVDLLNALNKIMYPDSKYDGITIQKYSAEKWEVFLYENENRFPLSKIGSGIKTIILVLLNLLIMPCVTSSINDLKNVNYANIVFAFEELENNLHPALQRRLFNYLYQFSIEHDTTILLTTHSHVAINMFADKNEAQLYHVIKKNGKSSIHNVEDYITKCEILNELDVRASDIFQSNGIIWVEGPSDKVYIKRWLELWGDQSLVEGVDYQFLYYGGRILSHFTADSESTNDNLISILSTNRNAAIVIDSDICGKRKDINITKKRIKNEFEAVKMLCWITAGKEIENYVSFQAINTAHNSRLTNQCGKNEKFTNYIKKVIGNLTFDKVGFAHKVIKYINDGNSGEILDLKKRIEELSAEIKKWNRK